MTVVLDPEGNLTSGAQVEPQRKIFAVIGTREPDENQAECAKNLAFCLAILRDCTIRTGGAYGIDQRAMEGSQGRNLEVFLPWSTYNRDIVPPKSRVVVYNPILHISWADSVRAHHPAWDKLSRGSFALHARNFGIICGEPEARVHGVLAFPDERGGGGTGQGIRIAATYHIPIVEGRRGKIENVARFMGNALRTLGLTDAKPIIPGRTGR